MSFVICLFVFFGSFLGLSATTGEIEFTGELRNVEKESDGVVLLAVGLRSDYEILVRATETTEIHDENDMPMTLYQLEVGTTLKVLGLFTHPWILAQEIEVTDNGNKFEIKGKVEQIDTSSREIQVLGFVIQVPVTAQIKDDKGAAVTFSDLEVGDSVEVEGEGFSSPLEASKVTLRSTGEEASRVKFEGILVSVSDPELQVELEGVGPVLVRISSDTVIEGFLTVGVLVRVVGNLDDDLAVRAWKITVVHLLRLVPERVVMSLNETHTVQAILSQTLDVDASLDLISMDPAIAEPLPVVLVIPAGEISASFSVLSRSIEGETSIQASLGSETANTKVKVEEKYQEAGIEWVPTQLKMGLGEMKTANLMIDSPAPSALVAKIFLEEGSSELVQFPHEVTFSEGSYTTSVVFYSRSTTGKAMIGAKLPDSMGGHHDFLEVEVWEDSREELEVYWEPEWIEAPANEAVRAHLVLNTPAPFGFAASLKLKKGRENLVEFSHEVRFSEGSQEAEVLIHTGKSAGGVTIQASLPHSVGSGYDYLRVEVVADHREELEVHWEPEWIEAPANETVRAHLVLNTPAPFGFAASLKLKKGRENLVEFSHEVRFSEGSQEAEVLIHTGKSAGEVTIKASLPHSLGGGYDYLEVTIREDESVPGSVEH